MNNESKNTVPNIWLAQENTIRVYKLIAIGLSILSVVLMSTVVVMSFSDPVVVSETSEQLKFYPSKKAPATIGEKEIKSFSEEFLRRFYVWSSFDPEALKIEISPLTEENLVKKAVAAQLKKYGSKDFAGKKIAQAITFVRVNVFEDRVECLFDRVLKIDGLPLVIPTTMTLSLLKGKANRLNPMGVYVVGINESEGIN